MSLNLTVKLHDAHAELIITGDGDEVEVRLLLNQEVSTTPNLLKWRILEAKPTPITRGESRSWDKIVMHIEPFIRAAVLSPEFIEKFWDVKQDALRIELTKGTGCTYQVYKSDNEIGRTSDVWVFRQNINYANHGTSESKQIAAEDWETSLKEFRDDAHIDMRISYTQNMRRRVPVYLNGVKVK